MRKKYLLFIASAVFCSVLHTSTVKAQDQSSTVSTTATVETTTDTETVKKVRSHDESVLHPTSVGLLIGTAGVGLEASTPIAPDFCLRPGFSYVPKFSYTNNAVLGDYSVSNKFKTQLLNIHLFGDYYLPALRSVGWRLTGGIAGFIVAKSDVVTIPTGDLYYGDIPLNNDPERMGEVKSKVSRNGFAFFIGTGFEHLVNTEHFALSLDLGTYYSIADPSVEMTTTGYLVGNERNEHQLKENLSQYRWLPTLQVGLHYKF
jgi:hypothetical protein